MPFQMHIPVAAPSISIGQAAYIDQYLEPTDKQLKATTLLVGLLNFVLMGLFWFILACL